MMRMYDGDLAALVERALRGYTRLNACQPGWQSLVDWKHLDMEITFKCLLGQLYGSSSFCHPLSVGTKTVPLGMVMSRDEQCHHGFDLTLAEIMGDYYSYDQLKSAWLSLVGNALLI